MDGGEGTGIEHAIKLLLKPAGCGTLRLSLIFIQYWNLLRPYQVSYEKKNFVTNTQSEYRIVSKTQNWNKNGEWLVHNTTSAEPSMIFPVYQKNNILFINKEMYLFNKPGFCWDGESRGGKYHMCIQEIMSSLTLTHELKFDSVYVYTQQFYNDADSSLTRVYMSRLYPIILKQEREQKGRVVESEQVVSFSKN